MQFTTGSSQLPTGGFADLKPLFQVSIQCDRLNLFKFFSTGHQNFCPNMANSCQKAAKLTPKSGKLVAKGCTVGSKKFPAHLKISIALPKNKICTTKIAISTFSCT